MYGPNLNWVFLDTLEEYNEKQDMDASVLINIGSCGIHVLNRAHKNGPKETDQELENTFKTAHSFFKNVPAEPEDYLSANEHEEHHNDKSLCVLWWLQNGRAITCFFEIINKSAAFMAKLEESKIFPKDDEIFPFFEEVQSLSRIL